MKEKITIRLCACSRDMTRSSGIATKPLNGFRVCGRTGALVDVERVRRLHALVAMAQLGWGLRAPDGSAWPTPWSAETVVSLRLQMSPMRVLVGSSPSATARTTMSRSVRMPYRRSSSRLESEG